MTSKWLDRFRQPVVIALVVIVFIAPFIYNARANATDTYPTPHGGTHPLVYHSLVDSYQWIKENTPPNAVIAVEWSYGHLLTGLSMRRSVTDGAQTTRIWENRELPPPDYVQRDVDGDGKITEADDIDGDGKWEVVGGRRPDMQNLYNVDKDEFAQTIRTYRDNYGIKIDYVVFNFRRIPSALPSASENFMRPQDVSKAGRGNILIQFDNENILYNTRNNRAIYRVDGTFYFAAVITYVPGPRGWAIARWTGFPAYNVEFTLEKINPSRKVLKVFYRGRKIGFRCGELEYIPMVARVGWHYPLPPYLTRVHESPYNYAMVGEIHHAQV